MPFAPHLKKPKPLKVPVTKLGYLLILILGCSMCFSQKKPIQEKPTIGLVLSGGGAKGIAHIGVLKVLEEEGIVPDYIAGTSMGAIIGGLYATGYSAKQLETIFLSEDLSSLIQDIVPRNSKNFYEKEDYERYALSLPFDNFSLSFPDGFSGGRNVYNRLVQLMHPVRNIENFENLPIPFLCVATDLENGVPVILDSGFLPEAVMASGALPSLFEPAEIQGKTLIDGGVSNNFPVEELKARGIDYIIGLDVQDSLLLKDELSSITDILFQINNYRTVSELERKKENIDVYIKPEVQQYSVISFDQTENIINLGESAAIEKIPLLKALVQTGLDVNKKKITPPIIPDSLKFDQMVLMGNEKYTRGYLKGRLRMEAGNFYPFEHLNSGMNNLAASENFKALRYTLKTQDGKEVMTIKLRENPNKMFLKMAAHYDDLYKTSALINITKKNFLLKDDLASFDFIIGDNLRYNLQYYLDKGSYWSYGLNSFYNTFSTNVNNEVLASNFSYVQDPNLRRISLDFSELTNQIYVEKTLKEEFALRLGVEHKHLEYSTETFEDVNINPANERYYFENSDFYSTYGQLTLDTYNDKYFPTEGLYFKGDFHLYLSSSDFNKNFEDFAVAQARMGSVFSMFQNLYITLETEGGFKLGTSRTTSFDFMLGGYGTQRTFNFIPFVGYDFLSLPGNSFVKATSKLDYHLSPKSHLIFIANMANITDDIFRTGEWWTSPDFTGFGIGYGVETFLGPAQLLYTWTPQQSEGGVFISIGYHF